MRTRLGLLLPIVLCLSACGGDPAATSVLPTPSNTPTPPEATPGPPACAEATLMYDASLEAMLLANCVDQSVGSQAEQLWAWDGRAWALVDGNGPEPMVVTGGAFDTARGVLVRYGGLPLDNNDCVPETWEWDHAAWSLIETPPPAPCDHMVLSYDARHGQTVLYGGGDADGNLLTETWTWDGVAWQVASNEGPPGRAHFGLVDDPVHGQVLLYGGYDGSVFDDFWSWDGATWTELDFPGPGARSHFGMAANPDGLLIFGGANESSTYASLTDETWWLTNGEWSMLEGPAPSPRGSPTLGYDSGRGAMVLYGGFDSQGTGLADTWEWTGAWTCVAACD